MAPSAQQQREMPRHSAFDAGCPRGERGVFVEQKEEEEGRERERERESERSFRQLFFSAQLEPNTTVSVTATPTYLRSMHRAYISSGLGFRA